MADLETCSECTTEVPFSALRENTEGALLCPPCLKETP